MPKEDAKVPAGRPRWRGPLACRSFRKRSGVAKFVRRFGMPAAAYAAACGARDSPFDETYPPPPLAIAQADSVTHARAMGKVIRFAGQWDSIRLC